MTDEPDRARLWLGHPLTWIADLAVIVMCLIGFLGADLFGEQAALVYVVAAFQVALVVILRIWRVHRVSRHIRVYEQLRSPNARAAADTLTVIDALARRKDRGQLIGTLALLAAAVFALYGHQAASGTRLILLVGLLVAVAVLNVGAFAFAYRVSKGLYGTNAYEARELIFFVLRHKEDIDLSGGLGARDLQLDSTVERAVIAAWEGARA